MTTGARFSIDAGVCRLRLWEPSDAPALVRHGNNREVWKNLREGFPHPYTAADATRWLTLQIGKPEPVDFAIEYEGGAVGAIGFVRGSDVERMSSEIGYWLGEEVWGRGIATAAVRTATSYGFEVMRLSRIFALPFAYNRASHRVLEKCGYEREGTLRNSALKDGRLVDQLLFARIAQTGSDPGIGTLLA